MINYNYCENLELSNLPSPCFVVDKSAVERNLKILADVQDRSGAKILAALKAFSFWQLGELTGQYLSGTCASGINEARLGKEHYPGEVHTYSAGFKTEELKQVLAISDHVVFNSFNQWQRFQNDIKAAKQERPYLKFGLRINPEHSEGTVELYDPCSKSSRLGIRHKDFVEQDISGITGLHFHTLCEQGLEPLKRTFKAFEQNFGHVLKQLEWLNLGGGHHITATDYDRNGLVAFIQDIRRRYDIEVYLEPGEAIAINTGVLIAEVVDIIHGAGNELIAILDTSATCHMPDTLEMPYRPDIRGSGQPNEKEYSYTLGGMTCLAGDVINQYSFDRPLHIGQRLIFEDMSHYTMVKTTTFNGINLPSLALYDSSTNSCNVIKHFGYDDFKDRLS